MMSSFLQNMTRSGQARTMSQQNIVDVENLLLDSNGQLRAVPAADLKAIPHRELVYFCNVYGFYSIPSIEFIELVLDYLPNEQKAIEIGAGNGIYGRNLHIHMTDNYMQHPKNRAKFKNCISAYEKAGLGLVPYDEKNVEELDAKDAVRIHKPHTVFGAWTTQKFNATLPHKQGNMFGVAYQWIYDRKSVEQIILVGNTSVHSNVEIMKHPHEEIRCDDILFSRAFEQGNDRLYVWNK